MEFLAEYGYMGMFIAAFIAGSVFPFSSEAVMTALLMAGLAPVPLFVWGTVGNIGGSMFNYWVGSLGRLEWIERYLHVKREKVEKTQRFMAGHGAWMGILCFLPVLGSAIAVTLGFMRASLWRSLLSISIGKAVRYALLIMAVMGITSCTSSGASDERRVMVSIAPLEWAARQVIDSTWTVDVLVPRGSNPETYEPTAQEMMRASQAAFFFHTGGLGFEKASMERMKKNAPLTRFVSLEGTRHDNQPSCGHHHHDPHIWTSPRGMMHIMKVMAATLGARADSTATMHADSLLRLIPRGTAFAIYHPSLTQIAEDYGLHQICIETDGKEPSPAQLAHTIDRCRQENVAVVFLQQEFDRRNAELIARQIGARVVTINPLSSDWPGEIEKICEALAGQ